MKRVTRRGTERDDRLDWLEKVWIEVADEIAFETSHPQALGPQCVEQPELGCNWPDCSCR